MKKKIEELFHYFYKRIGKKYKKEEAWGETKNGKESHGIRANLVYLTKEKKLRERMRTRRIRQLLYAVERFFGVNI